MRILSFLSKPILMFVTIILSLLMLELACRWYFYRWNTNQSVPFLIFQKTYPQSGNFSSFLQPSPNAKILFEFKPNINSSFLGKPFYTNSDGLLGKTDYQKEKAAGTIRIVGIGDSLMSSWGVDFNETYLAQLQEKINSGGFQKNIEIMNFAVPGYNTAIEREVIESKALAYDPDLIIIGYVGNDLDLPNHIRKKIVTNFYLFYVVRTTISALSEGDRQFSSQNVLGSDYLGAQMVNAPLASYDTERFAYENEEVPKEYQYMVGLDSFLKTMGEIAEITIRRGIPVILLVENNAAIFPSYPRLKEIGYHIIDASELTPVYLEKRKMSLEQIVLSEKDRHLNPLGHLMYSSFIYDYLMEHKELIAPGADN